MTLPARPAQRVVIVGSGSAGRRHAAALRAVLPDADIVVVRRAESVLPIDSLQASGVRFSTSLSEASSHGVDIGVVAGPASFHADAVGRLLDASATVLVEKPLASTLSDAERICLAERACARSVLVGYHLRFADTVMTLRRFIRDDCVGRISHFSFSIGQHLDQWRPGTDPRQSVTARAELGGGVLLELSHEFDGVRHVLGRVLGEVESVSARTSVDGAPTDGVVETVADVDLTLQDGTCGLVHLDMVAPVAHRTWSVTGARGTLVADLITGRIELRTTSGVTVLAENSAPGERDRSEHRLISNLIDMHRGVADPICTSADGLAAVAIAAAARRSAADRGSSVPIHLAAHSGKKEP